MCKSYSKRNIQSYKCHCYENRRIPNNLNLKLEELVKEQNKEKEQRSEKK